MKKEYIIGILVVVVIVIGFVVFDFRKSNNKNIEILAEDNTKIEQISEKIAFSKESLKNTLNKCEKEYQETAKITNAYTRNDFYNQTRIDMNNSGVYVDFVNTSEINAELIYNVSGEQIETLPETTYFEQKVNISDNEKLSTNKYYLIKYQTNSDEYTYYYIGYLTSVGFNDFEVYCVTRGERVGIDSIVVIE